MPKINVYLPEPLAEQVRAMQLPVSPICQSALAEAVERVGQARRAIAALRSPELRDEVLDTLGERLASRVTPPLWSVLLAAAERAHPIGSGALLDALVDDVEENLAQRILVALGVDLSRLRGAGPDPEPASGGGSDPAPSPWRGLDLSGRRVIAGALEAAIELGHNYIGCEHLLLGLALETESAGGQALARAGLDAAGIRRSIASVVVGFAHAQERNVRRSGANTGNELHEVVVRLTQIEARLSRLES